jgi:hypothetical protein
MRGYLVDQRTVDRWGQEGFSKFLQTAKKPARWEGRTAPMPAYMLRARDADADCCIS